MGSGLLLGGSFPPLDLGWLAWVALVPLLLVARHARPMQVFVAALAGGILFHQIFGWWMPGVGVHRLALFLLTLLGGLYLAAFAVAARFLYRHAPEWAVLGVVCCWGVLEYARAHLGWLATPWGVLGYSQYQVASVVAVASIAGVWGVSFVLAGANALLVEVAGLRGAQPRRPSRGAMVTGVAIAALLLSGWAETRRVRPPGDALLRVAVIQAGVPEGEGGAAARRTFEAYSRLTREAGPERPELVVWPEAVLIADPASEQLALAALGQLAGETGASLLVGASGHDKFSTSPTSTWSNSVFLISPEGRIAARYNKIRLLPFNEYVPMRTLVAWPSWIVPQMVDARRGSQRTIFEVDGVRFGTSICWENAFSGEFRATVGQGVDLMVSVTNEGFSHDGTFRRQTLAINALRAVENGVPVVRAATTGVSALIGTDGQVLERLVDANARDLDAEDLLSLEVPVSSRRTLYSRFGEWLVGVEGIAAALVLGVAARRRRSMRS